MFKLTICRDDETVYWVEHFNTIQHALTWLAEEQTRPYWDATYTHKLEEIS